MAPAKLTVEEKVRIQLDELVESYEKRTWNIYTPQGLPVAMFLGVIGITIFILYWVALPYMSLFEEMSGVMMPWHAGRKVVGAGLIGYLVFCVVTLIQQKVATGKAVATFNLRFSLGGHERAIAIQLLAVKPGRGANRLFKALGGVAQIVADSVSSEESGSEPEGPAFQPIPIEADTASAKTPAAFTKSGPPQAKRGYIPLQPDAPSPERAEDEPRPKQ